MSLGHGSLDLDLYMAPRLLIVRRDCPKVRGFTWARRRALLCSASSHLSWLHLIHRQPLAGVGAAEGAAHLSLGMRHTTALGLAL